LVDMWANNLSDQINVGPGMHRVLPGVLGYRHWSVGLICVLYCMAMAMAIACFFLDSLFCFLLGRQEEQGLYFVDRGMLLPRARVFTEAWDREDSACFVVFLLERRWTLMYGPMSEGDEVCSVCSTASLT
jgi:hypothetical protein